MKKIQRAKEVDGWFYKDVHDYLRNTFGKANHCENPNCLGITRTGKIISNFEWALLHGKEYAKDKNNFIQLCKVCHAKYDNPSHYKEWNDNVSKALTGKKLSEEHKAKVSLPEHWNDERKLKISNKLKNNKNSLGHKNSDLFKSKMSEKIKLLMTPEMKQLISDRTKLAMAKIPEYICPYCNKTFKNKNKYHGEYCKLKII